MEHGLLGQHRGGLNTCLAYIFVYNHMTGLAWMYFEFWKILTHRTTIIMVHKVHFIHTEADLRWYLVFFTVQFEFLNTIYKS